MTDLALRPTWQMTDQELLAEADAIARADDKSALADPVTLMRHLTPGYKRRAHLRVIGRELRRLHTGETDRLMILTPPQVGKSVTAVVGGSFWWLALHPAHRVIVGSYGNSLALNRGRSVRKMVIEHGHRYDLRLERGSQAVNDWQLTTGGGMKSVGVGAGVTGVNGDIAMIDDPHKSRAEADSLRRRDAVHDWYSGDIISRLSPGAPVVLIMTPWHPDDIRGRLLADEGRIEDGGRWRVIHMPALCVDPANDPLGRPAGAPLPHPKIPPRDTAAALRHWEDRRRSSSVRDWAALYQGDPKPAEGALLSRKLLRERRCYGQDPTCGPCNTTVLRAAVAVDPSGGGRDTAGLIAGYLGGDRRLYITHDASGVMSSHDWSRKACELAADTDADRIIVETDFGGDMATLSIRTAWEALRREEVERWRLALDVATDKEAMASTVYTRAAKFNRLCPRIVTVKARKGKLLRAEPIAQQWTEDRIRTAAYLPELEDEWATWQPDHTDSPGRIDASTYLAYALLPVPNSGTGRMAAPPSGQMPSTGMSPLE
ncbi:terminase large subunit domain-containing protein [Micromonospora sp. WMMC273]|uniref:terminase large subunit domain-containing protein n=1 Tax=Micromonospora sp. WMMC273 TaxID=3015157 RepID=UPI0022B6F6C6|nr:terminase family protein [Micromonospora sp. WMMC273]MCZ7478920.1 hypothetical protein [Micromonospora sp. WMMC273]